MEKRLKVLIYGDTLVLGCLRASLASYEGLELASLEEPVAGEQELRALGPDVIIFDLEAGQPAFQYSLVVQSPDLLMVGVDSATNRVLTWSGRQLCQLSTAELVQMIEGTGAGHAPAEPPVVERQSGDEDLVGILEVLDRALDELSADKSRAKAPGAAWVPTRKQKLVFGFAAVVLAACLVAVLLPGGRQQDASLMGVAVGTLPAELGLAFVAGLLLGALALGVWTWERRK